MYDPLVGRFLEEDPLDFAAGDPHLYRYVHNNPTNATDPSGLFIFSEKMLLSSATLDKHMKDIVDKFKVVPSDAYLKKLGLDKITTSDAFRKDVESIFKVFLDADQTYTFNKNEQLANFLAYQEWRAVFARKFATLKINFSSDPQKKATVEKCDTWEPTKVKFNVNGRPVEFGAIVPKKGVSAADAITDLFNGKWEGLSVDCITAQTLINRRAMLEILGKEEYDKLYDGKPISGFRTEEGLPTFEVVASKPVLKNNKPVIGEDGKPVVIPDPKAPVAIGSTGFFENPGAVKDSKDPKEVEASVWLNENVIYLGKNDKGEDMYLAHGIGIATKTEILEALKQQQKRPFPITFATYAVDYGKLPEKVQPKQ